MSGKPDPRFADYTQMIKNGEVVGFYLKGDDHQYLLDKYGGWFDKEGKYFNSQAIQCDPPIDPQYQSSASENQQDDAQYMQQNQNDMRIQTIKKLMKIVDHFQPNQLIQISISTEPQLEDSEIQSYLKNELGLKVQCSWATITLPKEQSEKIINLQGSKINNSNAYIDVHLKNGVQKQFKNLTVSQVEKRLVEYIQGCDFGNLDQTEEGISIEIKQNLVDEITQILNNLKL